MSEIPTLSQVLALLDRRADPATAEDWDRVGLVVGEPTARVATAMFAVDPRPDVIADAVACGYRSAGDPSSPPAPRGAFDRRNK
ncbi:MAG: Nif3-like dinuclear metal center hexameric protein [Candidatus Nanopelagicales bacterium]